MPKSVAPKGPYSRIRPGLTQKYSFRLEMLVRDKHCGLFVLFICDEEKVVMRRHQVERHRQLLGHCQRFR
jgi:hypothetical protein